MLAVEKPALRARSTCCSASSAVESTPNTTTAVGVGTADSEGVPNWIAGSRPSTEGAGDQNHQMSGEAPTRRTARSPNASTKWDDRRDGAGRSELDCHAADLS